MKYLSCKYHKDQNGNAYIYQMDNGVEYVIWSNGNEYAYKGCKLLTPTETHEINRAVWRQHRDEQMNKIFEEDMRFEKSQ
jgi:hypothetical protein